MSLPDVLQWIAQSTKTGTLLIDNGECTRRFEIDAGAVTGISSSKAPALLGLSLVEQGMITLENLQAAVTLQKEKATSSLLGKVLVDLGTIGPDQVERTLKQKIQENVLELLETPKGGFQFVEHESSTKQRVPVRFNINDLLLSSVHVLDEARAGRPMPSTPNPTPKPPRPAQTKPDPTPILSQAVKEQGTAADPNFGPILLKPGATKPRVARRAPTRHWVALAAIAGTIGVAGIGSWWASSAARVEDGPSGLGEPPLPSEAVTTLGRAATSNGASTLAAPSAPTAQADGHSTTPPTPGGESIGPVGLADQPVSEESAHPLEGSEPYDASAATSEQTSPRSSNSPDSGSAAGAEVANPNPLSGRQRLNPSTPYQAPATTPGSQPAAEREPVPPVLVVAPTVKYPELALRRRQEGVVDLRVKVDTAGRVVDAEAGPNQDVASEFLQAAIAAAMGARYQPATRDGKPVEYWAPLRIAFELK